MQEIKAIIRPERLSEVLKALHAMPDLPGVTTSKVRGMAGATRWGVSRHSTR